MMCNERIVYKEMKWLVIITTSYYRHFMKVVTNS